MSDTENDEKSVQGPPPPRAGIDFEALPWNLNVPEELNYVHLTTTTSSFPPVNKEDLLAAVKRYSSTPLGIFPSSTSLNYGTTVWEGLKCFRAADGTAVVFRPDMNFKRFVRGAEAMCLPPPSYELFMRGIQTAIQANACFIPPYGEGMKLYVRPMLLGSGQQLGLYPSKEFSLLFFVSPTGNYFSGKTSGLNLHLETKRSRAARGGVGSVKCAGNYAVALKPLMDCKKHGFDDNLYLELETYDEQAKGLQDAFVQELSAANVFAVLKTGEIVTPSLDRGTILPGVTRDSVVQIIREFGEELKESMVQSVGVDTVSVSERDVAVRDFQNAAEVFVTGTAAELVPVKRLATFPDGSEEPFEVNFAHGKSLPGGPVTAKLLLLLREIMAKKRSCDATNGWLKDPFSDSFLERN